MERTGNRLLSRIEWMALLAATLLLVGSGCGPTHGSVATGSDSSYDQYILYGTVPGHPAFQAYPVPNRTRAELIGIRRALGLPVDAAHLAAAEHGEISKSYGIPLSASDRVVVDHEEAVGAALNEAASTLNARYPSTFAGLHMDNTKGGAVTAKFTKQVPVSAIASLLPADTNIRVELVRFTIADLELVVDRINAKIASPPGTIDGVKVVQVGVPAKDDWVEVTITNANRADAIKVLKALAMPEVKVRIVKAADVPVGDAMYSPT